MSTLNINDAVQGGLDESIALGIMDPKLLSTIPGFYASVVGNEAMTFSRIVFPIDDGNKINTRFEPESNFLQIFGIGLFLAHSVAMVIISLLGRRRRKLLEEQEVANTETNTQQNNKGDGCLNTQEVSTDGIIVCSLVTL